MVQVIGAGLGRTGTSSLCIALERLGFDPCYHMYEVLGSEERALAASDALLAEGLLVPAIRPPSVPPGTCRLRVALSAAHSHADVARLVAALAALREGTGAA